MDKRKLNIEKKKKEIENLIEELKENSSDITKDEINELEELLEEILRMEQEPLGKRIGRDVGLFSIHFALMYFVSILAFGLFFQEVTFTNKFLVFLVAGIISMILTAFEDIPRNPFRKHFISMNLMIFTIIILGIYIFNRDVYSVFQNSITWVFYLILVMILYYFVDKAIRRIS